MMVMMMTTIMTTLVIIMMMVMIIIVMIITMIAMMTVMTKGDGIYACIYLSLSTYPCHSCLYSHCNRRRTALFCLEHQPVR